MERLLPLRLTFIFVSTLQISFPFWEICMVYFSVVMNSPNKYKILVNGMWNFFIDFLWEIELSSIRGYAQGKL